MMCDEFGNFEIGVFAFLCGCGCVAAVLQDLKRVMAYYFFWVLFGDVPCIFSGYLFTFWIF